MEDKIFDIVTDLIRQDITKDEAISKLLHLLDVRQRSVAVISLDTNDFKLWKRGNNLKHDGLDTQRRFKVGNTTYYCISKVCDLCSLALDEVTETEYAKENKEYEQIKLVARGNLSVA